MTFKQCFPPVVDVHARVLILGSLPGEASLAQSQYYAYKHSQFWRLAGAVIGQDLPGMEHAARLKALLAHRIGLWDAVTEAKREGSLDSKIRDHAGNDLAGLIVSLPEPAVIAFNGGTTARIGMKVLGNIGDRHVILKLPSNSPVYAAVPHDQRLVAWQTLREWLSQRGPANLTTKWSCHFLSSQLPYYARAAGVHVERRMAKGPTPPILCQMPHDRACVRAMHRPNRWPILCPAQECAAPAVAWRLLAATTRISKKSLP